MMAFLRSRRRPPRADRSPSVVIKVALPRPDSPMLKSKKVVVRASLPRDPDSEQAKALYSQDQIKALDRTSKSNVAQLFSFLAVNKGELDDESSCAKTDTSDSTLSSRDMDSLNEIEYDEIAQSESGDSSVSNSVSSLSLDGQDDTRSSAIESSDATMPRDPENIGGNEDQESSNGNEDSKYTEAAGDFIESNENTVDVATKPPTSTIPISPSPQINTSDDLLSKPKDVSGALSKTKPQKLRELRRRLSEGSKSYIHVFHNQLTTLEELPLKEEDDDDDVISDVFQKQSSMTSFDECKIRQRWNYSLQMMAKQERSIKKRLQNSDMFRVCSGTPVGILNAQVC
jgi:hypothetical protein